MLVALVLSFVPTPYYVVAPGRAVDQSTRVAVEGHAAPRRRFYLTDVTVARASVPLLLAGLWPGVRIVRRDTLVPQGESARAYDLSMVDAMNESQAAAAIAAERAAGYAVPEPAASTFVRGFLGASPAAGALEPGDAIVRVGPVPIRRLADLRFALRGVRAGSSVTVGYVRAGRLDRVRLATIAGPAGARLGIFLRTRTAKPDLPVAVRYEVSDIAGSSGGLMFALEIYASLHPAAARDPIAGTGTIGSDGRVGPIEGVEQKLIAARRAGARTFLV
ncbi:MAG: PDZ domain-containing protein, partial [Candidatus Eremiobacteraeota bacterium]|nr:PDZ domain-containing protein [Candidatus Eremiobacteraeota bacterium]